MLNLDKEYGVSLSNGDNFYGIYKGRDKDNFLEFLTTDSNKEINEGGSSFVMVPATYFINIEQIVCLKEKYNKDEQKEYWTFDSNNYDFIVEPVRIYLTDLQKNNFKKELFETKEECEKYLKEKENE